MEKFKIWIPLFTALGLSIGFLLGYGTQMLVDHKNTQYQDKYNLRKLKDVYHLLDEKHVDPIDWKHLTEQTIHSVAEYADGNYNPKDLLDLDSVKISQHGDVFFFLFEGIGEGTYKQFMSQLEYLNITTLESCVLDFRKCKSMDWLEWTKMASLFIPDRDIEIYEATYNTGKKQIYASSGRSFYTFRDICFLLGSSSSPGLRKAVYTLPREGRIWDSASLTKNTFYLHQKFELLDSTFLEIPLARLTFPVENSIKYVPTLDSMSYTTIRTELIRR